MGFILWIAFLIGIALLVIVLKARSGGSASMVVTGPGVLKTLDIECRFWSEPGQRGIYHGKLSQDRWSDGQERFSLRLHKLPQGIGKVRLMRGGEELSEFEARAGKVQFAWKGHSTDNMPKFEIGQELVIQAGDTHLTGVVEPD